MPEFFDGFEEGPTDAYDPYAGPVAPPSVEKINAAKYDKEDLTLWKDSTFPGRHPYLYATARTALDMLPYGKYGLRENREEFMQLSKKDQHLALTYDMLENELFYVGVPAAFKGIGMLGKKVFQRGAKFLASKPKLLEPVEDVLMKFEPHKKEWKRFDYAKAVEGKLGSSGFKQEEAKAAAEMFLTGNDEALLKLVKEKELTQKSSKGFKRYTTWSGGTKKVKSPVTETAVTTEATSDKPVLVDAWHGGSEIYLSFDGLKKQPTQTELKELFKTAYPDANFSITRFSENILSTVKGVKKYRVGVHKSGSNIPAKDAYKAAFGTEGRITGESIIESNIPLNDRFKAVLDFGKRQELGIGKAKKSPKLEITQEETLKIKLNDDIIAQLDHTKLRGNFYRQQFKKLLGDAGYNSKYSEQIFKDQATKYFDPEAFGKVSWGEISEKQATNMLLHIFEEPSKVRRIFMPAAGEVSFPMIQPQRVYFGAGEALFKTKSNIYDPITSAISESNKYKLDATILYGEMLAQRGFGEMVEKGGAARFKPNKKLWNKENLEAANNVLTRLRDLSQRAGSESDEVLKVGLLKERDAIRAELGAKGGPVSHLVKVYHDFHDALYADHIRRGVPSYFHKAGLSPTGMRAIDKMLADIEPTLQATFSSTNGTPYVKQLKFVDDFFKNARKGLRASRKGEHPWFTAKGRDLQQRLDILKKDLTTGENGNFPSLLEDYAARVYTKGVKMDTRWNQKLRGNIRGFFTRESKDVAADIPMADYMQRVQARIGSQAKDLYLYPAIDRVAQYANGLPQVWKNQTDYLIGRALNRPSNLDHWVATSLERTIGPAQRLLSGDPTEGLWNTQRYMQLSQTIQDFTYMGFLGFKPFSAMRNMFQPLVTGVVDIGGISDLPTLFRGMAEQMSPVVRKELRAMGIITEYVPELSHTPLIPSPGMGANKVKDLAMWMFKKSDNWNRYTMGRAAMIKWDRALAKAGGEVTSENINKFLTKSTLGRRNPWVVAEIEEKLLKGQKDEARKLFIKDVVADTQYLYGSMEAPTLTNLGGATGKVATTFQSWWMNYGALLEKWFRTAEGPTGKTGVMVNWMLTSAIAEQTMETMWGRDTAMRQAFLGPLPMDELGMPPAFRQVFEVMKSIKLTGQLAMGLPWEEAEKQYVRTLKRSVDFVPGGNQIMSSYAAWDKKPSGETIAKSLLGLTKKKEPSATEKWLRKNF